MDQAESRPSPGQPGPDRPGPDQKRPDQPDRKGQSSRTPPPEVAAETGASYGGVLYVDSLSEEDGPVPTYLAKLKVTVSTIVQGLKR